MTRALSLSDIQISRSSYVDPNGFVFGIDGGIYRAIRPDVEGFYRQLITQEPINELVRQSALIDSQTTDWVIPEVGISLVLKHPRIDPANYCVEWCPSMLKDAALTLLNLADRCSALGYVLQDAYPWNILFDGTRPVHVDLTSIVPAKNDLIWPAFQQFLSFFLYPLELCAMGKGDIARLLLYDHINGITLRQLQSNVSCGYIVSHPFTWLGRNISIWSDQFLQNQITLKQKLRNVIANTKSCEDSKLRTRFMHNLKCKVSRIRVGRPHGNWVKYYGEIEGASQDKIQNVEKLLTRLKPKRVLDVGSNTGRYSILAAKAGAQVIALDSNEECIDALYQEAKDKSYSILTLVGDILHPTPAFGFMGDQFPSSIDRLKSEVVLCLGLMHHLHITGRQSFSNIAALLNRLASRAVIFEYVSKEDGNIQLIDHGRPITYCFDEVRQSLEQYFRVSEHPSDRATRKLLLCERV